MVKKPPMEIMLKSEPLNFTNKVCCMATEKHIMKTENCRKIAFIRMVKKTVKQFGILNGYSKEYNSKGAILREGNFKNDNEEGEWIMYEDSNVTKKVIYKSGEIIKSSVVAPAKAK